MITIPEQKLKGVLDYILKYIADDFEVNSTDETKTILYRLLNGLNLNDYNYYDNAKALFVRGYDSSRKIECHLFFNKNRASLPTIHIGLPSENPGPSDGVGFDQGVTVVTQGTGDDQVTKFGETSTRSFAAKYNIVFTSANTFETLIMYYVIKSIIIGNIHFLEMNSLRNPRFSGGDIMLDSSLVPDSIYARALFLDCHYDTTAPGIDLMSPVMDISFLGYLNMEPDPSIPPVDGEGVNDFTQEWIKLKQDVAKALELAASALQEIFVDEETITGKATEEDPLRVILEPFIPYVGENGNWWVNNTDTGEKAQGPSGTDGIDGVDGKSQYESYLETTTDNPPLTEQQWAASFEINYNIDIVENTDILPSLRSIVNNLNSNISFIHIRINNPDEHMVNFETVATSSSLLEIDLNVSKQGNGYFCNGIMFRSDYTQTFSRHTIFLSPTEFNQKEIADKDWVEYLLSNLTIPTKTSELQNDSDFISDDDYVHTDNNYTTVEKNKLAGIADGAEVNVNADWNAISGDSQILNKPTEFNPASHSHLGTEVSIDASAFSTNLDTSITNVQLLADAVDTLVTGSLRNETQYASDSTHSYMGSAPSGSLTGQAVWNITRMLVNNNGSVTLAYAANVKWDDVLTTIYN